MVLNNFVWLRSSESVLLADDVDLLASSVRDSQLPQVKQFKYLGVLFKEKGKIQCEIHSRISAVSALMLCCTGPLWI